MTIRKAILPDLVAVEKLYEEVHDAEESGRQTIGWIRGVYPVRSTAEAALERGDLYVLISEAGIRGAAIINQIQVDVYALGHWQYPAPEDEVCVLHTLVISPEASGRGLGKAFVRFYEDYALAHGCLLRVLSHLSHARLFVTPWTVARQDPLSMGFSSLGYWSGLPCPPPGHLPDAGIVPCPGRASTTTPPGSPVL